MVNSLLLTSRFSLLSLQWLLTRLLHHDCHTSSFHVLVSIYIAQIMLMCRSCAVPSTAAKMLVAESLIPLGGSGAGNMASKGKYESLTWLD